MEKIIKGNKPWTQVARLIRGHRKTAAIAYVSKGAPLLFEDRDTLVCDASDGAIKAGQTDARTLGRFLKAGATLFSFRNLHAKLLVSGNVTVIGSANLSSSAQEHLVEALLVTDRSQVRSQALALMYDIRPILYRSMNNSSRACLPFP
jgi:phosphatidylserine/phosphatidylglycerophosphate/cardiolipin synthase-like enzyme